MSEELPLFRRFPALAGKVGHVALCKLPTPVEPVNGLAGAIGMDTLYFKRDDLSAEPYGGNKVRKLEFLLADARARGLQDIICFGFAGSNFVAACGWYARALGLRTHAMLLPQHNAAYLRDNLRLGMKAGIRYTERDSVPALGLASLVRWLGCLLRSTRVPAWFPAGGSSPVGMLGYVNAGLELAEQIEAGLLPAPARIYVPMGSMGTAVGLRFGLGAAGVHSRIIAVRVVQKRFASARLVPALEQKLSAYFDRLDCGFPLPAPDMPPIEVRDEFFGEAYGAPTPQAEEAIALAGQHAGLSIDGTYSGKALAALIADARAGQLKGSATLFWTTFNSRPLADLIEDADPAGLPARLRRYFVLARQDSSRE